MPHVPDEADKDIDVLFYGAVNERRARVLEAIEAAGARLKTVTGVYAAERDAMVARSRIVLNLHYYPMKILETVRVSYLLNNGCFVLSEESQVNPYARVGLFCRPYEKLASTCGSLLERPEEIRTLALRNHQRFKTLFPMTEMLRRVLAA